MYLQTNNTFQWANGWPIDATIWGPHQPVIDPMKQCVRMSLGNTRRGADWFTDDCRSNYSYICKVSFDGKNKNMIILKH